MKTAHAAACAAVLLCLPVLAAEKAPKSKTPKAKTSKAASSLPAPAPAPTPAPVANSEAADNTSFLNWEHSLVTRTSKAKHAVAKLKIYNNWTPSRHRLMVKYNVLGLGIRSSWISEKIGPAFSMPNFDPSRFLGSGADYHNGTFGVVSRLDDDKIISYNSEENTYFSHSRLGLMKRVRFDPFKKVAPELSKETPVSLTPAQRERLGREVRAVTRPMMKKVMRTFFRALPEKRTFKVGSEQIEAQGYRLAMLVNTGGYYSDASWARVNMEWWIAPGTSSDEIRRTFVEKDFADLKTIGGISTSMWFNEMLPVMWQTMPQELHKAIATFLPQGLPLGEGALQMSGAPVYAALTLMPPKEEETTDETGTIRVEITLTGRDSRKLDNSVFEAPARYKKESIEAALKEYEEGMEAFQSAFDDDMKLSRADIPGDAQSPKYTWRAMRDYLSAVQSAGR